MKAAGRTATALSPITVTASTSSRSAGGKHDYFSEADYFWPDPKNPDGPYIQRDGMSNPNNFVDHRRFLIRLSLQVPELTAAWRITGEQRYAAHAVRHLRAWFIDPATRMNPNLQYSQASAVHPKQEELAASPGRDIRQGMADAPLRAAVCGTRVRPCRLYRHLRPHAEAWFSVRYRESPDASCTGGRACWTDSGAWLPGLQTEERPGDFSPRSG